MQKKLIALAIAGLSGAAFAQSNVTISGNLDMGYYAQSMQTSTIMDTRTAAAANGSSTSTWRITGEEALGGGMKAGFQLENDLAAGADNRSGIMAGQSFLSLSGGWGSLKAGNVNTAGLTAGTTAQPFGTAIGGGYSGAFGRLSRAGVNGAGVAGATAAFVATEGENPVASSTVGIAGARTVRMNNSLMYATPSFSGFSATLQLATKNTDAAVAPAGQTAGYTGLGLNYNNGPINVAYANEVFTAGSVAPTTAGISVALVANEKVTHNLLAGNYTFGPATVYAGWTSSKGNAGLAAPTADSRSWNIALKYAVTGALSLMANVLKVDDKLVGNQDRNVNGLGLDYALSKRTTAYGRYETGDNDKSAVVGNGTGGFSRYQIGMRHSF
ncbi:MAG: porin [Sulfuritalea sp.]|nr:porin [Sulfuritalea sp.]